MEILTSGVIDARSAFEAMLSGKPVVCRDVHSELIRDYSPIADFAADIYANPNFEFAIQIELIELAGFTFTKPYTLDELANGDAIFVIDTTGKVFKGVFDSNNTALIDSVNNGSVQRNEENAVNQIKAWRKVLGLNEIDIVVTDFPPVAQEKPKRKAAPKNIQSEASNDVEKEPSTTLAISKSEAIDIWREYKDKIPQISSIQELKATGSKIFSMDCFKYPTNENIKSTLNAFKMLFNDCSESLYNKELNHLTEEVNKAHTPSEANSVVEHTKDWTEEQRKPLLKAISARLVHLNKSKESPTTEKKTIAMRITQASNLEELDVLSGEIVNYDEVIHPQLHQLIENRKIELENAKA